MARLGGSGVDETNDGNALYPQNQTVIAENEEGLSAQSVVKWLVVWSALALAIRFFNLTAKPAWMDEVSTVMFSLGNSSRLIPTDQVISLDQILIGLRLRPDATAVDAARYLLAENNHPPAYFMLAHGWMKLAHAIRGNPDGYASLWDARALSALFGVLAVPATYSLSWLSFRDSRIPVTQTRTIGLLSAALMALSPYSVFLSQEARHYTLAILMIIASLCCFALAVRAAAERRPLGWATVFAWIVINALSIAVHYFCGIAICAEGLVLLVMLIRQCRESVSNVWHAPWPRIYTAALGSLVGGLVWLPVLLYFYDSPQTTYIKSDGITWKFFVDPIAQSVVGWLYALFSPITSGFGWQGIAIIVVTCILLLFIYAPWMLWHVVRSLKALWTKPGIRPGLWAISGFFLMGNLLFFFICYAIGFDITRGHRYSFVYFPSVVVLVSAGLSLFWQRSVAGSPFSQVQIPVIKRAIHGRTFVIIVLSLAFLGTQVIVNDLSHLKFYKPNRFVELIEQQSTLPAIIAVDATISAQPTVIGNEIVSVAWEIKREIDRGDGDKFVSEPRFVIAERNLVTQSDPRLRLIESLKPIPLPYDLWVLKMEPDLEEMQCLQPPDNKGSKGSYRYTHYICKAT